MKKHYKIFTGAADDVVAVLPLYGLRRRCRKCGKRGKQHNISPG